MKKFSTKVYITLILLFILIFGIFAGAYALMARRYLSNISSDIILRMDKQIGLTVDQKVERDYERFEALVDDIDSNLTLEEKYQALKLRQNEFKIEGINYNIGYVIDTGYVLNDTSYNYDTEIGKSEYYQNAFAIYRMPKILGDNYTDNTNYAVFRKDDLIVYFDVNDYLYNVLNDVEGMPDSYFMIIENNCGIAYQEDNTKNVTSLLNGYISEKEAGYLASAMQAERKGGYEVLTFENKASMLVYTPVLSNISNDNFYLVYVVDQKLALSTVSYLSTSLIVAFVAVFILINIAMIFSVVDYVRKEQDLRKNRLRYFFAKPYIILINKKGDIKDMNRTMEDNIQGYRKYKSIFDFKFYDLNEEVLKMIHLQKTITIEAKDKNDNKIYLRMMPLKTLGGYTLIGEDITVPLYEQIKNTNIALYNGVTHLPNKFLLEKDLNLIIESPKSVNYNYSLVVIDFIDFAKINRMFGFSAGDRLLLEESKQLKSSIDNCHANIYNIRTSIFCILFYDLKDFNQVIDWDKQVSTTLSKPVLIKDNFSTLVDFKIGIYNIEGSKVSSLTASKIYDNAYGTLERAKNSRLLKTAIFNSEFGQLLSRDQIMEQDLFNAVKNREFEMYFQPQYNTRIGKIVGFEALIRWNNPKYIHETVENYIKIAEKNGLIMEIGKFVITETFKFAKSIENTGIHISINVSPAQLLHSGFVTDLLNYFNEYNLKPKSISIEITETFLMENSEIIIEKLRILRDKGFGIHLDDFGIGYSSMLYLKDLPVDTIKIDKEFIKEVIQDKFSRIIVTRIVQLALGLDLNLVAEGVENEKQMNFLARIGCDVIQGYLISRPVNQKDTLALITKYNGNYRLSDEDINEQIANVSEEGEDFAKPIAKNAKKKKSK